MREALVGGIDDAVLARLLLHDAGSHERGELFAGIVARRLRALCGIAEAEGEFLVEEKESQQLYAYVRTEQPCERFHKIVRALYPAKTLSRKYGLE